MMPALLLSTRKTILGSVLVQDIAFVVNVAGRKMTNFSSEWSRATLFLCAGDFADSLVFVPASSDDGVGW